MKRLGSSGSLGALMSICPISDGFDEEESGYVAEKKRRLNVDQVKGLEKDFEVENKLDPVRKLKLAQELGLEPRQVAVWFQNRRARWKTKQLERDYGVLKTRYETLKVNYDTLHHDNQLLLKEIEDVKEKLNGGSDVLVSQKNVKMEEHDLLSADEACNFFSDEEAPSLHWYCSEQWN